MMLLHCLTRKVSSLSVTIANLDRPIARTELARLVQSTVLHFTLARACTAKLHNEDIAQSYQYRGRNTMREHRLDHPLLNAACGQPALVAV